MGVAAMSQAEQSESFLCTRLRCTISRGACAERFERWSRERPRSMAAGDGSSACACRGCPIGAQHARGQRADVKLVQVTQRGTSAPPPLKRCLGCGEFLQPRASGPGESTYARTAHGPSCRSAIKEFHRRQHMQLPEWA